MQETINYSEVDVVHCCYCHAEVYESVGQLVTVADKNPICHHCPDTPPYHHVHPITAAMVDEEDAYIQALPWGN